jgi:hypothetical protein
MFRHRIVVNELAFYSFGFPSLGLAPLEIITSSDYYKNTWREITSEAKMSLGEKIRSEIEVLRALEERAFGPRHGKFDFYDYLDGVWKLYSKWKEANKAQTRAKRLASMYKFKLRKNTHPIRAIIDASSKKDGGDKSEWTQALKYAERNRSQIEKVGLRRFLEDNGGPAGCADKGSTRRAAKKRKVRSNWGRRSPR